MTTTTNETPAEILRRLNDLLGHYHTLPANHPLVAARDELAFALAQGDGQDAAAGRAATALRGRGV